MKFGSWVVTKTGIEWQRGLNRFIVNQNQLLDTTDESHDDGVMYKWILLATEEDWLSDDDLYDFNFAFVYAAARSGDVFNYEIFDRTLAYQYELLDDEEDDDF
jgi:hypothetical protein